MQKLIIGMLSVIAAVTVLAGTIHVASAQTATPTMTTTPTPTSTTPAKAPSTGHGTY